MNRTKFLTVEIDLESSTGEKRVHRDRRKRRASLGDRRRIKVIDRGARRIKGKRAFLGHFGTFSIMDVNTRDLRNILSFLFVCSKFQSDHYNSRNFEKRPNKERKSQRKLHQIEIVLVRRPKSVNIIWLNHV